MVESHLDASRHHSGQSKNRRTRLKLQPRPLATTNLVQSLKLRDVTCGSEARSWGYDSVRWATLDHPDEILDLVTLRRSDRPPDSLRMHFFDCNAPGSTGYSVATDGVSIATIHTHGQQGDDVRFYKDFDPASKSWIWILYALGPW